MAVTTCTKGSDKTCTDVSSLLCCASITLHKAGSTFGSKETQDDLKENGYPLSFLEQKHNCQYKADIALYKDNLGKETDGNQFKVYCDAAIMMKATIVAGASAIIAASF